MQGLKAKFLIVLLSILTLLFVPFAVHGEEATPLPEGQGKITINFHTGAPDSDPIVGNVFHLYRVATLNDENEFTLTEQFAGSQVKIEDLEDSALVRTLAAYAAANGLTPEMSGVTNNFGRLVFEPLDDGLYLIVGENHVDGKVTYTPTPFIVPMPSSEGRDMTVEPKYDRFEEKEDPIERRVLKIWKDEGYENERPAQIVVQLLCDNEVYDEVILNAENNWRHTWSDLESGHNWQIAEKEVPEGYTVSVDQQGITFTVTNTYNPPPPPPTEPPPSEPPPSLPQTGMLWWPIPVLLGGGVLLMLLGALIGLRKKGSRHG